jgi:hypothetical protein
MFKPSGWFESLTAFGKLTGPVRRRRAPHSRPGSCSRQRAELSLLGRSRWIRWTSSRSSDRTAGPYCQRTQPADRRRRNPASRGPSRQRQANPVPQPDWRSLISDLGLKDVAGQYFALADGPVGRLQRSRGVVPARRDCALPVRRPRPAAGAELASLRHPTEGMWLRTEFASHST